MQEKDLRGEDTQQTANTLLRRSVAPIEMPFRRHSASGTSG